jgi:hypothetical protein
VNGKKYIAGIIFGAALLGSGFPLHWQHGRFLAHALRAPAEIIDVRDDGFVTAAADIQTASLVLHRCKYTIRFMPNQNQQIETRISEIANSCMTNGGTVQIIYDKRGPSEAMLYTLGSEDNSVGKILIAFGAIALGIVYFMWVGDARKQSKPRKQD